MRDQDEVVTDDVDTDGGEEEKDDDPEFPVGVGAAPVGRAGVVGGLVGLGCGVFLVGLDFAHGEPFGGVGLDSAYALWRGLR
jgi:hypothetical protein